ncbi:MAG: hypothetical protein ACLPY5_15245 [Candidatus Bathyarchaeia archaeon]
MTKADHVHQYGDHWKCTLCGYVLSKELWDLETQLKAKPQTLHDELRRRQKITPECFLQECRINTFATPSIVSITPGLLWNNRCFDVRRKYLHPQFIYRSQTRLTSKKRRSQHFST